MIKIQVSVLIFAIIFAFASCKTSQKGAEVTVYKDSIKIMKQGGDFKITLLKGKEFNHPTYAIWAEDMEGNFLETIFITQSYASGIFSRQMVGDTMWLTHSGESYQPGALPYWTHKKGLIDDKVLVPTKDHPYVDGYSGATVQGDFVLETKFDYNKKFRILLEVNQPWDWNKYWTTNKYPDSDAYKHAAQPSVVYAVTINENETEFYLNPIGHGDPKGKTGKLFTNISTLTTAFQIFESIKVEKK